MCIDGARDIYSGCAEKISTEKYLAQSKMLLYIHTHADASTHTLTPISRTQPYSVLCVAVRFARCPK